jgi:hypothetical protein
MFKTVFVTVALSAGAALAAPSATVSLNFVAGTAPVAPANTITISNALGAAVSNYPFQFGRPFLDGAIPHAPQVLINGQPLPTQADVKNRYPDGSAEFAVIAGVISPPCGRRCTGSSLIICGNA